MARVDRSPSPSGHLGALALAGQRGAADHPHDHDGPVIIERADWQVWLGEATGGVSALLAWPRTTRLRFWQVTSRSGTSGTTAPN